MTTPRQAPESLETLRTARREVVKRHHPDVGGGSDDLREALHRVEREHGAARHVTPIPSLIRTEVLVTFRAGTTSNGVLITVIRRLQRHLPRRVPGSRRYIQL